MTCPGTEPPAAQFLTRRESEKLVHVFGSEPATSLSDQSQASLIKLKLHAETVVDMNSWFCLLLLVSLQHRIIFNFSCRKRNLCHSRARKEAAVWSRTPGNYWC